jgi:hypothetical protein
LCCDVDVAKGHGLASRSAWDPSDRRLCDVVGPHAACDRLAARLRRPTAACQQPKREQRASRDHARAANPNPDKRDAAT